MHHTGAQQLNPALAMAGGADLTGRLARAVALEALHVDFAAWLREREMMRAEAHDGVLAVQALDERLQRALQVAHRDALVDDEALNLMEHRGVRGVGLILAEHAAGGQHADGRLLLLHDADLHGAGLRAQQDGIVVVKIEGVGAVAGGMALFDVQLREVVGGLLDLRAVDDLIAHADEDLLDLLQHAVHRVLVAHFHGLAGNGDIHGLGLEL